MADTLEQVQASDRVKEAASVPAPAPSKPKKRRRINLPESYPKQGFSLGEMPLTLFILLAGAIVYLRLSGKGIGHVATVTSGPVGTPGPGETEETYTYPPGGPVRVNPPAPQVDLPAGQVLVPVAPGTPVPTLHEP